MLSSPLSNSLSDRWPSTVSSVTWLLRIAIGCLFIFSGFTKGIDVWGTLYKFEEYFGAMGYEVWPALNLFGVVLLCLVEFLVGFSLLFGCFRLTAPIVGLLIMCVMLPLTLWLAVANPITDCGCFGDFIKMSNWATFWKNIVLTLGLIWLVKFNKKSICLITPYLQWIAIVVAGAYLLVVAFVGYNIQPLLDFRPYKTGTELISKDNTEGEDYTPEMKFIYEKDGERKAFGIDDELPDESDGWVFIERVEETTPTNDDSSPLAATERQDEGKTIRFFTEDGHEDVTEDVIGDGRQLILVIPELDEVPAAKTWKINSFYDWCKANDVEMLAAVGGNPSEIERWKDISLAQYPIYTSDDTALKEVVRGNPGIVYLEDGVIKWKTSLAAINIDDFQKPEVSSNPMSFVRQDGRFLRNLTLIFILAVAFLVFLSFFPRYIYMIFRRGPIGKRRFLAEWENPVRVMMAYPKAHMDWNENLPAAEAQFDRLILALKEAGEEVLMVNVSYNDTWTRDYGPLTVDEEGKLLLLDFGFNGWGEKFKASKDNLVTKHLVKGGVFPKISYRNHRDFILEGGSVETDGKGTLLTTSRCLLSKKRNPGKSRKDIEKTLRKRLGVDHILWLDYGYLAGDDTDSHIDTLARLAPDDTIVYVAPPEDKDDEHYEEFVMMRKQLESFRTKDGKPFRLIALPFPDAIYDSDGERLPATYANYLVTGHNIFVPAYNQPEKDSLAMERLREAFPEHKMHAVDCTHLITQHGSLHCSTMQLYF